MSRLNNVRLKMSQSELTRSSDSDGYIYSKDEVGTSYTTDENVDSDGSDTQTDQEYIDSLSASSPRVVPANSLVARGPPDEPPPRPPSKQNGAPKNLRSNFIRQKSSTTLPSKNAIGGFVTTRPRRPSTVHEMDMQAAAVPKMSMSDGEGPLSPRTARITSVVYAMRASERSQPKRRQSSEGVRASRATGDTTTCSDDGHSSGTPRDAVEFDEHGFKVPASAVAVYRAYRAATVGQEDSKMQQYAELLDPRASSLRDHKVVALLHIGIPPKMRRMLWLEGSGVRLRCIQRSDYYDRLEQQLDSCTRFVRNKLISGSVPTIFVDNPDAQEMFRKSIDNIDTDINRTLGENRLTDAKEFTNRLLYILRMYCLHVPHEGYTQGMHFFGMAMLVHGMSDCETFWMLDYITQHLFPLSFDRNVTGQMADQNVFCYYANKAFPKLIAYIENSGLTLQIVLAIELFGALGHNLLPHHSMYVLWDWLFLAGAPAFFGACMKILRALHNKFKATGEYKRPSTDPTAVKLRIQEMLSGMVNMPLLLSTTKLPREIDLAALNVRRTRERLNALQNQRN